MLSTLQQYRPVLLLAAVPLVSAFIGYLTNRIALWMLFHPRRRVSFLGLSFHGLIPGRQKELARAVAETVTGHLVTPETIASKLQEEPVREALARGFSSYLRRHVADLIDSLPAPALILLPRDIEDKINRRIERHAREHLPELAAQAAPAVASAMDLAPAIERQVASYPPEELEALVKRLARKEMRAIEIWGAVLGLLIGFVQAGLVFVLR